MVHASWRRFGTLGAVLIVLVGTMFASIEMVSANASSPTQPSVALSSSAAGASGVTYTVGFSASTTGAIPSGGTITLVGPPGTVFPGGGRTYAITDSTTPSGSNDCISCSSGAISVVDNGAAVTIRLDNAINASDALSLSVSQVTNPAVGTDSLALSTSADTTPVESTPYTITPASSVTQPSVALSSRAAGASGVSYTLGFSASGSGALPAGDTITLVGTPGTIFPGGGRTYAITDSTTPSGSDSCISCTSGAISVADNGAAVTIRLNNSINASDALSLSVFQVTNPGVGTDSIAVSTSTDATPEKFDVLHDHHRIVGDPALGRPLLECGRCQRGDLHAGFQRQRERSAAGRGHHHAGRYTGHGLPGRRPHLRHHRLDDPERE